MKISIPHYDIAVIGGGAAGFSAAILAARELARKTAKYLAPEIPPYSIVILEKNSRGGKKLLRTGNGRCNLGNTAVDYNWQKLFRISAVGGKAGNAGNLGKSEDLTNIIDITNFHTSLRYDPYGYLARTARHFRREFRPLRVPERRNGAGFLPQSGASVLD